MHLLNKKTDIKISKQGVHAGINKLKKANSLIELVKLNVI